MSVKIRLQRRGRKKHPFYHIIVADSRAPRDGRFIEKLGMYNPLTKPATIDLDSERALDWLLKGAQPTYTAKAILRYKGVLYRKHLLRGVEKGALTQEEADAKFDAWIKEKEAKIAERRKASEDEIRAFHKQVSGTAPPMAKPETTEEAAAKETAAPERKPQMTLAEEAEAKAKAEAEAAAEGQTESTATEEVAETKAEETTSDESAEEPVEKEETPEVTAEAEAAAEGQTESTATEEVAETKAEETTSDESAEEPVEKEETPEVTAETEAKTEEPEGASAEEEEPKEASAEEDAETTKEAKATAGEESDAADEVENAGEEE